MKTCVLVSALAAVAGLAASANAQVTTAGSVVTVTVHFVGDTGNLNGIIEPGESAIISFDVAWTGRNTTATFSPAQPPNGSSGTIRGLGGGFVDLVGTGGAVGTWAPDAASPTLGFVVDPDFDVGQGGAPGSNGVNNIQFGQLPPTAAGIRTTGPITPMWVGIWTPNSYADRDVSFNTQAALAAGLTPFSVLFKTINSLPPPANGVISAFLNGGIFQGSGNIHITPSPSSLALLGLGGAIIGRRRRR